MKPQPPGTILQQMYLKSRFKSWASGRRFLEIGSGKGVFSNTFLMSGFSGLGVDLNAGACTKNEELNRLEIKVGKYEVRNADFTELEKNGGYDVVFSCMVIEHIPDDELGGFMNHCKEMLNEGGRISFIVPASMKHWGIEDEIAGHIKRYEREDVYALAKSLNMKVDHIAGLTYPLSNWLFNISNSIISKNEKHALEMNQRDKTVYTGNREVQFKTDFPSYLKVILNPIVMSPFYFLQWLTRRNQNAMVLYFELIKS